MAPVKERQQEAVRDDEDSTRASNTNRPAPPSERFTSDPDEEQSVDESSQNTCPDCSGELREVDGEICCQSCQLVVEDQTIDPGPEYRIFGPEDESKKRTGPALSEARHDRGLSTEISWKNEDASGSGFSERKRYRMNRLRKLHKQTQALGKQEQNLRTAFGEIKRMSSALGIPKDIEETACVIHRRAVDEGFLPGRSIEGVSTAALAVATRQHGHPIPLAEFESVIRLSDERRFHRTYRSLVEYLSLEVEPARPKQYLARIIDSLTIVDSALKQRVKTEARTILSRLESDHINIISGRKPTGVAAAAIYVGSGRLPIRFNQTNLADAANITEVTLRNRMAEIAALDWTPDRETIRTGEWVVTDPEYETVSCPNCEDTKFYAEHHLDTHRQRCSNKSTETTPPSSASDTSTEPRSPEPRSTTDGTSPAIRLRPRTTTANSCQPAVFPIYDAEDSTTIEHTTPLTKSMLTDLEHVGATKADAISDRYLSVESLEYAVRNSPDDLSDLDWVGSDTIATLCESFMSPEVPRLN
jgi:transcription initiation factor TFIIB